MHAPLLFGGRFPEPSLDSPSDFFLGEPRGPDRRKRVVPVAVDLRRPDAPKERRRQPREQEHQR